MANKLKEVTYLTVKDLQKEEIVLPSTYSYAFEANAKELEVDFDKKNEILKDLEQDINYVNKIVDKTSKNLDSLRSSTSKAQKAIKDKDEVSLGEVNTDLLKMQDEIDFLKKELFSDSLTKAYNRRWFNDIFLNDDKFKEDGHLVFIDIDKFKNINDNYGHLLGDKVLKYLVMFLKKELDYPSVNVIRYAGDEFMVVFPEVLSSKIDIQTLMLSTQEKLSSQQLKSGKVSKLQFSFSFGLVKYKENDDIADLIEEADEKMYENKKR